MLTLGLLAGALIRTGIISWLVRMKVRRQWVPIPITALALAIELPQGFDPSRVLGVELVACVLLLMVFGISDDIAGPDPMAAKPTRSPESVK